MTPGRAGPGTAAGDPLAVHPLYDVDPDVIAARVLACPSVAALSGGPFGAAATYLPGRTVPGVRLTAEAVEVHVVARWGPPVAEVAAEVRRALSGSTAGRRVDLVVEDVVLPEPGRPAAR